MHIYLIGMMGSGKTTIGNALAQKLSLAFLDTDHQIREEQHRSISEIFAAQGEAYFRKIERLTLENISKREACVVATGGGMILDPINVVTMRSTGVVFWLDAKPQILVKRIASDAASSSTRPLINKELRLFEQVVEISRQRSHIYLAAAHFTIDTSNLTKDKTIETIVSLLKTR